MVVKTGNNCSNGKFQISTMTRSIKMCKLFAATMTNSKICDHNNIVVLPFLVVGCCRTRLETVSQLSLFELAVVEIPTAYLYLS